jgi:hypothetical protein
VQNQGFDSFKDVKNCMVLPNHLHLLPCIKTGTQKTRSYSGFLLFDKFFFILENHFLNLQFLKRMKRREDETDLHSSLLQIFAFGKARRNERETSFSYAEGAGYEYGSG